MGKELSVRVVNVTKMAEMERRIAELERQMKAITKDRNKAAQLSAKPFGGYRQGDVDGS